MAAPRSYVLDQDPVLRELLRELLHDAGYQVSVPLRYSGAWEWADSRHRTSSQERHHSTRNHATAWVAHRISIERSASRRYAPSPAAILRYRSLLTPRNIM